MTSDMQIDAATKALENRGHHHRWHIMSDRSGLLMQCTCGATATECGVGESVVAENPAD